MPRYREISIKKEAKIIVWKITESEDELIQLIENETYLELVKSRKSISSRKQFLATRVLLEQEGIAHELQKDENGKPKLNNQHISITHDGNYVAIMLSIKSCGIDLQSISNKVNRVRHKFFDESDFMATPDETVGLTIAWCIKEAIYKIHGDPMIYFKEHMRIRTIEGSIVKADILHPDYLKNVTLELRKIDELYLSYTI